MRSRLKKVFIRAAKPRDYAACRRMANQKENREGLGFVSRIVFNDFAARQSKDSRYILLVAEDGQGKVVGFARALRLLNGTQTTLHEICRDMACKGGGVGRALLKKVEDMSRSHGIARFFLKVPDGIGAAKAYERFGFKRVGIESPQDFPGRKRRLKLYEKELV